MAFPAFAASAPRARQSWRPTAARLQRYLRTCLKTRFLPLPLPLLLTLSLPLPLLLPLPLPLSALLVVIPQRSGGICFSLPLTSESPSKPPIRVPHVSLLRHGTKLPKTTTLTAGPSIPLPLPLPLPALLVVIPQRSGGICFSLPLTPESPSKPPIRVPHVSLLRHGTELPKTQPLPSEPPLTTDTSQPTTLASRPYFVGCGGAA